MRNPFREYRNGKISWDEAFALANNMASTTSLRITSDDDETNYWAEQMDCLAVDLACDLMKTLGYKQNEAGAFFKPGDSYIE